MAAGRRVRAAARTAAAVGLLGWIYLIAAAVLVGPVAAAVLLVRAVPEGSALRASLAGGAALILVPLVLSVLWGVTQIGRRRRDEPVGVAVGRQSAPGLYRMVDRLRGELGVAAPARLVLTPSANASAADERVGGLRGLALCVGVPLLAALSPAELSAIACHELAHHAGRHTRLRTLVHRGAVVLESTVEDLRIVAGHHWYARPVAVMAHAVFQTYTDYYLRVSGSRRRRLEVEADTLAARTVGAGTVSSALRSAYAVDVAWQQIVGTGQPPITALDELRGTLADPDFAEMVADLAENPPAQRAVDAHPALGERLAMLELVPEGGSGGAEVAPPLVRDLDGLWRSMCAARPWPASGTVPPPRRAPEVTAAEQAAVGRLGAVIAVLTLVIATMATAVTASDTANGGSDGSVRAVSTPVLPGPVHPSNPTGRRPPVIPGFPGLDRPDLTELPADRRSLAPPDRTLVVAAGDTLSGIACWYRTSVAELTRLNHLSGTDLVVGQRLTVPGRSILAVGCPGLSDTRLPAR